MSVANRPRQHHHVPKFYLAGFTVEGTEDGKLHVLDQETAKTWTTTPRKAARSRDFYAVDAEGVDPSFAENAFAFIEGHAADVIKATIDNCELPVGLDLDILLNFIALQAVRVPMVRKLASDIVDRTAKAELRRWVDELPDTDDSLQFFLGDDYRVDVDQTWLIARTFEAFDRFLPAFGKRNWSLGILGEGEPDLICSDAPVCQVPCGPVDPTTFNIENRDSVITMPLTRRLVLSGAYEIPTGSRATKPGLVPKLNSFILRGAKCAYSAEPDFVYLSGGQRISRRPELISFIKGQTSNRTSD
jgi:hypothetical protein